MAKLYFTLAALCLIPLFAFAQNKDADNTRSLIDGGFRRLGGKLNMVYDGERLRMFLLAYLPDKNGMARKLIDEKSRGQWFSNSVGKVKMGGQEVNVSLSSGGVSYEIHNHLVQFKFEFEDIPYVVNEEQSIGILMEGFAPDSAAFTCTGDESIQGVQPAPESQTNKVVSWTAVDTNPDNRHCEYLVRLASSFKGAFDFSRLTLRQQNEMLDFFWKDCIRFILMLGSFWYLWYLLVAGRSYFEKADPKMVDCAIRWIPWLAAFYFILIFDRFVNTCNAVAFMRDMRDQHWQPVKSGNGKWRMGMTGVSVVLLVFRHYWRKGSPATGVLLIKALCRTFAFSLLAFLLLGAANQAADHIRVKASDFHDLGGYITLDVSAHYAVAAISLISLYLGFVFFKLFSFKRVLQVIMIPVILFLTLQEPYRIMGEAQERNTGSEVSFTFPIKKISEAKEGVLNLGMSFWSQAEKYFYLPLILAIYLMMILARRKNEQKTPAVAASIFTFIYCCYLVDLSETFWLLPVTLLAAIVLGRLILVTDKRTRLELIRTSKQLYALECKDSSVFRNMPELRQSVKLKETYRKRLLSGSLLPADYERAMVDLDKMVGGPNGAIIRRRLEFGPFQQSLRNGLAGFISGALAAGLAYPVFFKLYFANEQYELHRLTDILVLSLAGFCLGYFFPFLKGNTGWKKGAWLGIVMGLAHLPVIYLTVESAGRAPVVSFFFKYVIVLMLTGFVAFDLVTIRKIYGRRLSRSQVVDMMGWRSTLTLGTFILIAVGAGITAWISGSVQEILKSLIGK